MALFFNILGDASKSRHVVFIYHDETVFNAHDAHSSVWVDPWEVEQFDLKVKAKASW